MITNLAASSAASLSPGAIGLSSAAIALLGGLALAMHRKKKSPKIIGWICFIVGIPLAGLLSGVILGFLSGLTLFSIPVLFLVVGYVAFVFFHDGTGKGKPHRWLQPIFGLILPCLLLTLGGALGNGVHAALADIGGAAGSAVQNVTGH